MVFHWRLSDSKSQVFRTLLSILAVFNSAVVWMVSTRPPTSKSSRTFNNPLVTVPKAPITIGTIVTFMFHSFFNSLARSRYYYYYYYYYYTHLEFFTPALVDGFSLESEWLQVSSVVQDSSQYSGLSQQCLSLDGFGFSSDLQLFQPSFPVFGEPFQVLQLQLVSPSLSFSVAFFVFW